MSEKPLSELTGLELLRAYREKKISGCYNPPEMIAIYNAMDARDAAASALAQRVAALETTLDDIERTMNECGVGEFKTWKQAQDQAYEVVRNQADELSQWKDYATFLLSCIACGEPADSFEVWQKKVSEITNAR